ncbi:MAG: divergent PAP2 family protein [Anaerolineales bacterium]|jgi:acid phosphatase family membrane protein YuiD|nr:divergent PAP2 family protein [Anaerolineae bacterium]MCZ7549558.1 divergent PAP2 family protein [Anaerolineales bacterium]MDL1927034.1 divergent PAP2 family protein [Anaerolineae bacterium AMX1]GER80194.1 acid phosphatase family membrane protein YuiD [Candidatus Denitrolinea symbiosum]
MNLAGLLQNKVLIGTLVAWLLAQGLKPSFEYLRTRVWKWSKLLDAGGMPSSHSALIVSATHGIGLFLGFDSPLFALAIAITMIVVYDAAGVRRQAGIHAERINVLFDELMSGHLWSEKDLREVIGHTPLEVVGGILLGIVIATANWLIWK